MCPPLEIGGAGGRRKKKKTSYHEYHMLFQL